MVLLLCAFLFLLSLQLSSSYVRTGLTTWRTVKSNTKRNLLNAENILERAEQSILSYVGKSENPSHWRPLVTLSYAQTIDGTIAPTQKSRLNISSPQSFSLKHSLRSLHNGILIGANTMSIDAPRLDVRVPLKPTVAPSPRPIVLDTHLKILSAEKMLLRDPIVFTILDATSPEFRRAQALINGTIVQCNRDATGRCCIKDCLYQLYHKFNISSLLVEGGANVIQSFLDLDLVDQVVIFIKPCFVGGYRSLVSELQPPKSICDLQVGESGGDLILHGRVV